jgi:ankyrin repeat protein
VVALLLDSGAYANHMEVNGGRLTPLDYALINNHADVARILVCVAFSLKG